MCVAATCRRKRRQMKHDPRYRKHVLRLSKKITGRTRLLMQRDQAQALRS